MIFFPYYQIKLEFTKLPMGWLTCHCLLFKNFQSFDKEISLILYCRENNRLEKNESLGKAREHKMILLPASVEFILLFVNQFVISVLLI